MAGIFEPVELTWGDRKYVIPSSRVLRAIATIEEVITLQQASSGKVSMSRLAMAYGALLRFAGCKVTDDEVYVSLFDDTTQASAEIVSALLTVMVPKAVIKASERRLERQGAEDGPPAEGKDEALTREAS